ncbi:MAG: sulfate adenylyltransferase [Dehalococcoidia bacterium]
MSNIPPHGGTLVDRYTTSSQEKALRERAGSLITLKLNPRELSDLELIASGAFSPLEGFMGRDDYLGVVHEMHLKNGVAWSLPITLSASRDQVGAAKPGDDIALADSSGTPVTLLHLEEKYPYDKELEARLVYRTTDAAHPGVGYLSRQGEVLLSGKVTVFRNPRGKPFKEYRLDPGGSRETFAERGWTTVVGFQTRNPVHRAHEYIQKCALEIVDGLFLHPLVGDTKSGDIPAEVRMRCYQVLLDGYYPKDRVVLGIFPAAMRYAGPREAIFHAIVRKNYGCTHFIVGRDHAGVGDYYGTYDAQHIFNEFSPDELGIIPLFFEHTFYCHLCRGMASSKTCPHGREHHVTLSGTALRTMLQEGQIPPEEFTHPEVAQILIEASRSVGEP